MTIEIYVQQPIYSSKRTSINPICSVCRHPINLKDITKAYVITPHPKKVHGHCWLHITSKGSPIPWPRNLPKIEVKSQEQLPTIHMLTTLYNAVFGNRTSIKRRTSEFKRTSSDDSVASHMRRHPSNESSSSCGSYISIERRGKSFR